MSVPSPTPSEQLKGLRITAWAPRENRAWIPDAIHALIMAALARLFTRLEQVFLLWQSGNLPLPASRDAPQGTSPRPSARRMSARRPRSRVRADLNRVQIPGAAPVIPAPVIPATSSATPARPGALTPSAPRRVRSAHDPPPECHPSRRAPLTRGRTFAGI